MLRSALRVFCLVNVIWATNVVAADSSFQIHHATHLNDGDALINMTNTGAGASSFSPFAVGVANLCVNVYAFAPDERLVSCCSCLVTPNALVSLSAKNDLISNTLTGERDDSIVIKLLATNTGFGYCNAATAGIATSLGVGLLAWGTTLHTSPASSGSTTKYQMTETPFASATLTAGELSRITLMCAFMQVNGGGQGICRSCRMGALGATNGQ